ncbi:DUF397 domain-containing protein [Kitasatospora acidiphila]|uniref:DUF397 domain-containing protein n=1 Tax=Kitasatospora acidiphila TaxID=2567942 RepID=UPI003C768876
MSNINLDSAQWVKSTYSGNGGNCLEIAANTPAVMLVRDSKDPKGPALTFTTEGFTAFVQGVKNGSFDAI